MLVDCHAHVIPPMLLAWLREHAAVVGARWEQRADGTEILSIGGRWPFPLKPVFSDLRAFLDEQTAAGVVCSLISPVPQLFLYDAEAGVAAEFAHLYNHAVVAWCRQAPGRLLGLATVPLQDPAQAATELAWAMGQGLSGAILGPGCAGRLLSDAMFTPFWEEADRLGAIVFLHPLLSTDPRLGRPQVPNIIGVPWETTVAAVDLIFGGILDRYPKVRILLAHGGGYLPYQLGRFEQGYAVWPQLRSQLQDRPHAYLRRFWYDTVLWRSEAIAFLRSVVGADRIVPGSDYPFDLSVWPPSAEVTEGVQTLLGSALAGHSEPSGEEPATAGA